MEVIVGHINADFDCLGAMVAAHNLYPDALLSFPGSQEKRVCDFIARYAALLPTFTRAKDIELSKIKRLIIVDCQEAQRIGRFTEILSKSELSVHIYDHHPSTPQTLKSDGGSIIQYGSSSTIIALILQQQQKKITPHHATTIMLGIYEDTGKLLFKGTGVHDFEAAKWLLESGANLQIVADFVLRGLTTEQVALLDTLLKNLSKHLVSGVSLSITFAVIESYSSDISRLADMICEMENLDTLFVVVDMGDSTLFVARSSLPEVDAGEIMRSFGGGGHSAAASATIRNCSLKESLESLENRLQALIPPIKTARYLMSSPVKTMTSGISLKDALENLVRYNCTSMPIMKDAVVAGIISRKTIEKALYHRLDRATVDEYMQSDFVGATPETPLSEIQEIIVEENQRFIPVMQNGLLIGAITRTDLLRYLHGGSSKQPQAHYDVATLGFVTRKTSLLHLLKKQVTPELMGLLHDFGALADRLGLSVYAVGGFVRDLILGVDNFDLDLTVEGDGIFFAEQYVESRNCRMNAHHVFGTAVILFPNGSKVDVASTRLEYYESPGVLPTVERSSLRHDLYRRDFTINTLAISLNSREFGVVTDYFGGRADLQKKTIKVLHNLSFVEDPSRIFRAIRFEQRLGFTISPHTEHLMRSSIRANGVESIAGIRTYNELTLLLKEKEPLRYLLRMEEIGLLAAIHPHLKLSPEALSALNEAADLAAWFRLMYLPDHCKLWQLHFLSCTTTLSNGDFTALLLRLSAPAKVVGGAFAERSTILKLCKYLQKIVRKNENISNSALNNLLHGLHIESLLYLAALAREEAVRCMVSKQLTILRYIRTELNGNDLKELGLKPGTQFKEILQKVLEARLDAVVKTRGEELALARRLVEEIENKKR